MDIRHLVVKSFDEITSRDSFISNGILYSGGLNKYSDDKIEVEQMVFDESLPEDIKISNQFNDGISKIKQLPVFKEICFDSESNIKPLSQLFDYVYNGEVKELNGSPFFSLYESDFFKEGLNRISEIMFPLTNPLTNKPDIDTNEYFTKYIPLAILTGCITPQSDDNGNVYFNADGTVSVAEFIDSLNAIKYGANSNLRRRKSLDNVSYDSDYFNEGYQECLRGISSPFYNLYTREELLKPVTRLEAAYITVICWNRFIEKFNSLYSNAFYLGVNFDWEHPLNRLKDFVDYKDYKYSKVVIDKEYNIVSLNIKDYKGERSMTEFKADMLNGVKAIPFPMIMSMLELSCIGLFNYHDKTDAENRNFLHPLRELSRGEHCYFINMLSKTFTTKYEKS